MANNKGLEKDFHNQESVWARYITNLDELNKRRIEKTRGLIPKDTCSILEVGCGPGSVINNLSSYDLVVGLDLSKTALRYVTQKKVQSSCHNLPFRDKSFDIVIAAELLEHLDDQIFSRTVVNIGRVARKYILLSVPYREKPWETFVKCADCGNTYSPYNHQQYFDEERLRHLFRSKHLRIEFCGVKKRLPSIKKIMQKMGFYSYRENSICPVCGSKKLKYWKLERIMGLVFGYLTNIFAKSEPNWILCLYQVE